MLLQPDRGGHHRRRSRRHLLLFFFCLAYQSLLGQPRGCRFSWGLSMLSIDLSDAGQKGKSRSGKLVWGPPPQTVYTKLAFGIQSLLISVNWMPLAGSAWSQIRTWKRSENQLSF